LLEKFYNRKMVSRMFDNLKEALQHQKIWWEDLRNERRRVWGIF
jgi:hypothetical protein